MVRQYPHTIQITPQPELTPDADGNLTGTDGTPQTFVCRAEPAGSDSIVRGEDGAEIMYRWTVYMPLITDVFTPGDSVLITLSGGNTATGTVKQFSNGQLNTRVWV
jgi:hypothetical protein